MNIKKHQKSLYGAIPPIESRFNIYRSDATDYLEWMLFNPVDIKKPYLDALEAEFAYRQYYGLE